MTEHTPGPWHALTGPRGFQVHAGDHWIANLKCESCPAHEEANARLIAAAPETAAERDKLKAENERLTALNADLVDALKDTNELLLTQFGHVSNPSNSEGWSDEDAFATYWKNEAAIKKATT